MLNRLISYYIKNWVLIQGPREHKRWKFQVHIIYFLKLKYGSYQNKVKIWLMYCNLISGMKVGCRLSK